MDSQQNRFSLAKYFEFLQEEVRASWSILFQAYCINDSPRKNRNYVILEQHYSFANHAYYICSWFSSEDSMKKAFVWGLKKFVDEELVSPPKLKKQHAQSTHKILEQYLDQNGRKPRFERYPGHLKSQVFNDFEVPWFLAKQGQRIRGDKVIKLH